MSVDLLLVSVWSNEYIHCLCLAQLYLGALGSTHHLGLFNIPFAFLGWLV